MMTLEEQLELLDKGIKELEGMIATRKKHFNLNRGDLDIGTMMEIKYLTGVRDGIYNAQLALAGIDRPQLFGGHTLWSKVKTTN